VAKGNIVILLVVNCDDGKWDAITAIRVGVFDDFEGVAAKNP
jgi:hypothetical protein